jgi:single-stranded-DNA-specific exonuclease
MDVYLGPDWKRDTHSPDLFTRMSEAVARVFLAFERGEVITVHGDYDADGVCGTTVLISTLREICRELGFDENKLTTFIPDREKDGYGMSVKTIEHLNEHDHTRLVVTVDCGISNKEAIDRGNELGVDTIVCDHHTMPEHLPDQAILIHPLVPGETYPNKGLCGTGVAYKLAVALISEAQNRGANFPDGHSKWLLDLVAIATVTDVMKLQGENRALETYGLVVLNKTKRIGLRKLIEIAGAKFGELNTVSIGFVIGPRLNAAGRMTHANEALELLLVEDEDEANRLAMKLQQLNKNRQAVSRSMYEQARKMVDISRKLIIVQDDSWSPGLVGLVAGKLVSEFGRPAYCIGKHGDTYVGSGRSIGSFDVSKALRESVAEHLDKFGGHPEACGFSTTGEDRLARACDALHSYADSSISDDELEPNLLIDTELSLNEVAWDLFEQLERCRPFGNGNPEPVFVSRSVRIVNIKAVGKDYAHLKLTVQSGSGTLRPAIAFKFGHLAQTLQPGALIDIVYNIDVNEWNGHRELQLKIVDIKT